MLLLYWESNKERQVWGCLLFSSVSRRLVSFQSIFTLKNHRHVASRYLNDWCCWLPVYKWRWRRSSQNVHSLDFVLDVTFHQVWNIRHQASWYDSRPNCSFYLDDTFYLEVLTSSIHRNFSCFRLRNGREKWQGALRKQTIKVKLHMFRYCEFITHTDLTENVCVSVHKQISFSSFLWNVVHIVDSSRAVF